MNPVIVRNIKIGEGVPKICVPIVGTTIDEIINEAKEIATLPADIVEWRADWFENVFDFEQVKGVLNSLQEILGEKPILFTFRTAKEGGEKKIDAAAYILLNKVAIECGKVDLLDVEAFSMDKVVAEEIISCAHQNHVKVIASNHDFEKTPSKEEMILRLQKMQEIGADILKLAVMPKSPKDVLTLLSATEEVGDYTKKPIVTMSMSDMGLVSRIAGETFGSAITFGAAEKASAPGQIPAQELRKVLEILHYC